MDASPYQSFPRQYGGQLRQELISVIFPAQRTEALRWWPATIHDIRMTNFSAQERINHLLRKNRDVLVPPVWVGCFDSAKTNYSEAYQSSSVI